MSAANEDCSNCEEPLIFDEEIEAGICWTCEERLTELMEQEARDLIEAERNARLEVVS